MTGRTLTRLQVQSVAWQLGEAAMRLAVSVGPEEGNAIVAAFREMSLRTIMDPGTST